MAESREAKGFGALVQPDFSQYLKSLDESEVVNNENKGPLKKMPVSYLQEWCGRKKVTPIYEIRASEGQVHEPTFVYSVMVEDLTGMGRGRNKKMAKHYAALDALNRIVECGRYTEWFGCDTSEDAYALLKENLADLDSMPGGLNEMNAAAAVASDSLGAAAIGPLNEEGETESGPGNPIGKLSEICSRRRWPQPNYEQISEAGMPHEKTFVVKVDLGNFTKEGTARSKKVAKRLAAEAILKFLNEMPLEDRDKDLVMEEEITPEEDEDAASNAVVPSGDLHDDLANLVKPSEALKIDDVQLKINGFDGSVSVKDEKENLAAFPNVASNDDSIAERPECLKMLDAMDLDKQNPRQEHMVLFYAISTHLKQNPIFTHLQRKSKDGKCQCLLDFDDGQQTCFGTGDNKDEAEYAACLNALDLFKQKLD